MLPTALELKSEMDARRALFDATSVAENPEAARTAIANILEQIEIEINKARTSKTEALTSILFRVDPTMLAHPLAQFVRQDLVSKGYALEENAETGYVTISW